MVQKKDESVEEKEFEVVPWKGKDMKTSYSEPPKFQHFS